MKDRITFPLHVIAQIKPQFFLKFGAELLSHDLISIMIHTVYLCPKPELLHGHIFSPQDSNDSQPTP